MTRANSRVNTVKIVEVGPRDGLQNESKLIPADIKIELIQRLISAGVHFIEAGAFVSPKWVPQMADSDQVIQAAHKLISDQVISALVPNMQGYTQAQKNQLKEIAVFTAASESFTHNNINATITQSMERFTPIVQQALKDDVRVRGYVSCAVHCPYEGFIQPQAVLEVARNLLQIGCYEVSIGDTTGQATPSHIQLLFEHLLEHIPAQHLAGHFHDTYGLALANVYQAWQQGIRIFDTAVGGLGGCPYSPGASGNLATEDIVFLLDGLGVNTGINLPQLVETACWISDITAKQQRSKVCLALAAPYNKQ